MKTATDIELTLHIGVAVILPQSDTATQPFEFGIATEVVDTKEKPFLSYDTKTTIYGLAYFPSNLYRQVVGVREYTLRPSRPAYFSGWHKTSYVNFPEGDIACIVHVGSVCGDENAVNRVIETILSSQGVSARTNSLEWAADVLVRLRMPTVWRTNGIEEDDRDDDIFDFEPEPESSAPRWTSSCGRRIAFLNWLGRTFHFFYRSQMSVRIFEPNCPQTEASRRPTYISEHSQGCQIWEVTDD